MKEKLWKKENMVVLVLLGILLLVIAIPIGPKTENEEENGKEKEDHSKKEETEDLDFRDGYDDVTEYCLALEERIEDLLSCMEGVGEVQAMVTVSASKELIVEKDEPVTRNTVAETDGNGGTRSTNESSYEYETIYETDADGNVIPYVVKQIEPKIQGITIIAEGGGNAMIQKNISDVLVSLFNIEVNRIRVAKMK